MWGWRSSRTVVTLSATVLFVVVCVLPVLFMIWAAFAEPRHAASALQGLVLDRRQVGLLYNTVLLGCGTAVLATLVGAPLGFGLARFALPFKSGLRLALVAPAVLPPYVIALALLGVLGAAGQPLAQRSDRSAAELMDAVMWNREPIGGPFALIDQDGKRRTDADFRGKVLLVYFGFTYCPDVCPTDLQEIGLAVDRLGPAGDAVQPIFITLDPPRDTPEHLKEYVAMFHARFVGLTGDAAALDAAARAYRVFYARVALEKSDYTVDHSAFIYLMGRHGEYLGFFPPGTPADILVGTLKPLVAGR
jgi:protein SCO1/2